MEGKGKEVREYPSVQGTQAHIEMFLGKSAIMSSKAAKLRGRERGVVPGYAAGSNGNASSIKT